MASVDAHESRDELWDRYWFYRSWLNHLVPRFKERMSDPSTRQQVVDELNQLAAEERAKR